MKIIAHRSGPCIYPEQTVASAKQALADGADMVEIDVRLTKDGALAVCHDEKCERVFGDDRTVGELTAEEFCSLRHRDDPAYHGHLIGDYLAAGIKPLLIHIKEDATVAPLCAALDAYGYGREDAVFGVSNTEQLRTARALRKDALVLAFMPHVQDVTMFREAGVDYVRLWEKWLPVEGYDFSFPTWLMLSGGGVGYADDETLSRYLQSDFDGILINEVTQIKKLQKQIALCRKE